MLVKSIKLRDFQLHEELTVQLSRGITTIKGETDAGKSSILRALRWAVLNDIGGDEFIREGAKQAAVTITIAATKLTDAVTIERRKGKENLYLLDGEEYRAFGKSQVPTEILNMLGLSEINFQSQHDAPFWFNETAGEVSRRLNAVIDLSVIDTTLASIFNEVRRANERKGLCEERLAAAKRDFDEVEWQRLRVGEFERLCAVASKKEKLDEEYEQLDISIQAIVSNRAAELSEQAEQAEAVLRTAKWARSLDHQWGDLGAIIIQMERAKEESTKAPPDFSEVGKAFSKWQRAQDAALKLDRLITAALESSTVLREKRYAASVAETAFHLKTKNELCPMCGQEIK